MKRLLLFWQLGLACLGATPPFLIPLAEPPHFEKGGEVPYTYPVETDLVALFSSTYSKKAYEQWKPKNETLAQTLKNNSFAGVADAALIQSVYRELVEHPVAKEQNVSPFDPNGDLGYCFGRALLVHSLLRKKKIPQRDIAKLFIVGKLTYRHLMWDFHVTTLVRGQDKGWWAIDSLYEKPLPATEWMKRAENLATNQKRPEVLFALTDPRKFQAGHGSYRAEHLRNPSIYSYFKGLFGPF